MTAGLARMKRRVAQRPATLWQVTAPHFCAGLEINTTGVVINAAPILRWAIGRCLVDLEGYFQGKNWTLRRVAD